MMKDKIGLDPKDKIGLDPKDEAGKSKPQLAIIPTISEQCEAKALALGAEKYGFYNWRKSPVETMTYLNAIKRHLNAFIDGEDIDPESGVSHLGHIKAGCSILLDAEKTGTLLDNRPYYG